MDVELTQEESVAVRKALTSYLSDLRMEIADTDNPEYRRTLREERASLESAIGKLSGSAEFVSDLDAETVADAGGGDPPQMSPAPGLRVVRLWWRTGPT